jgi:hypothetical protein
MSGNSTPFSLMLLAPSAAKLASLSARFLNSNPDRTATLLKTHAGRVAPLTPIIPEPLIAAWAKEGATGRYSYQCGSEGGVRMSSYSRRQLDAPRFSRNDNSMPDPHRNACSTSTNPGIFMTFSCYRRMPLLTNDLFRCWLGEALNKALAVHDVQLSGFVFMPEHVHFWFGLRRKYIPSPIFNIRSNAPSPCESKTGLRPFTVRCLGN